MRKAIIQALVLFVLLALPAGLFVLRFIQTDEDAPEPGPMSESAPEEARTESTLDADTPPSVAPVDAPAEHPLFEEWEAALSTGWGASGSSRLAAWRDALAALPREVALKQLQDYWNSGRDQDLQLPFAPGASGELETAPTLRTAVLDLIGRWDPAAAHAMAASALEGPKTSADEYALHLRNYAWGAPEAIDDRTLRSYLGTRALELVNHQAWQNEPTDGYQEAFDILVWAGATEAVAPLANLMDSNRPDELAHPADLTVDRLVLAAPAPALRELRNISALTEHYPLAEAGYFARADPADPAQREIIEQWFLDSDRTAEQRDYLLQMLPNVNLRLSHNLLSENQTYEPGEVEGRFRAVRSTLAEWQRQPAFAPWRERIEDALARIDETLAGVD